MMRSLSHRYSLDTSSQDVSPQLSRSGRSWVSFPQPLTTAALAAATDQGRIQPQQRSAAVPQAATFGEPAPTSRATASFIDNVDAVLQGVRWASNDITFSFPDRFNDYELGYTNAASHSNSFQSLNASQRTATRQWFAEVAAVSNLNPTELQGASDRDATVRLASSRDPVTAYGFFPAQTFEGGDIWFNPRDFNAPTLGNYAYLTIGHEIGHALGLKHGHELGGIRNLPLSADQDSMEYSILTYRSYPGQNLDGTGYTNQQWSYAQSLMIYDVRALQQLYGANYSSNAADSTYSFSPDTGELFINGVGQGTPGGNRIFRTIWDGNGVDTYDLSNYATAIAIDLTPGGFSNFDTQGTQQLAQLNNGFGGSQYARGHLFNALQFNDDSRSLIENAIGGSNDDSLRGNIADNILTGNAGNDTLSGRVGNDRLLGGNNDDVLYGNDGNDSLFGNADDDFLWGGNGADLLVGGAGSDAFWFTEPRNGIDSIQDFQSANDFILISDEAFQASSTELNALTEGFTSAVNFSDSLGNDVGFRYRSSSGQFFFDSDGGDNRSGLRELAVLENTPGLNALRDRIWIT